MTAIVGIIFLFVGIGDTGIWDPHELERAELGRRIAIHVFGADELAVLGGNNRLPTLTDLGAGELGFTAMAWGFSTWGLTAFAGRLPLAVACFAAVAMTFAFVARAVSPRAGMFAGISLATMPAFFVQGRTMLGDAVTLAAFAFCFFGLGGALIDPRSRHRAGFAVAGIVGGICGFLSRGLLIGVAAPCLAVGLSWLALAGGNVSVYRRSSRASVGVGCLVVGVLSAGRGWQVVMAEGFGQREVKRLLGVSILGAPPREATFDLVVRELGHGIYPWSAFLPFAFGLILWRTAGERPKLAVPTLLVVGAACAYAVHALLAPLTGVLPFVGLPALAAVIGVAIAKVDRRPPLPLVGVGVLMLLVLLTRDLLTLPDKGLAAFAVADGDLPVSVSATLAPHLEVAGALFGLFLVLALASRAPREDTFVGEVRARIRAHATAFRELTRIWAGNLAFGFLVVEAGLLGVGATIMIGRRLGWPSVRDMSRTWAYVGLNLWWFLPLAIVLVPLASDVGRRGFGWLLFKARLPRSFALLVAALGGGGVLCFGFFDAMAAQLSPRGALDVYAARHRAEEPLGLLGVNPRMGRYYGGRDHSALLTSARDAITWLGDHADGPTRWMAFRESQLAELNALHRVAEGRNLAMVETGSGSILLALSDAEKKTPGANPLDALVSTELPVRPTHRLQGRFSDRLDVLGWDVVDLDGHAVTEVVAGRRYRMRLYLRVLGRIARSYRAFIHIDGDGRRFNGDHDVLGGIYPMRYWREGDHIVDEHEFALERSFLPGRYAVYFGYFIHRERMPVTTGKHHEDRLYGGVLTVR